MNPRPAMALLAVTLVFGAGPTVVLAEPCRVEVVESGTGWPVPLVELQTTHHLRWITDNAGVAAIDAPEVFDREVFFHVSSDGYEVDADGMGYRGVRLRLQPGTTRRLEVHRRMIARRVGRLTGSGLFGESQRTGRDLDVHESGIFGCDSVQTTVHRGRRYWLWGDTTLPGYPLGIFDSLGATSDVPPWTRGEPPLKPSFEFFRDPAGQPRGITPMPGPGPTWATALASLPSQDGVARLVCSYLKVRGHLEAYEWGQAVWNEDARRFDRWKVRWTKSPTDPEPPPMPRGHAVPWTDASGRAWMLFAHPFPTLRIPATFEEWQDPARWEVLAPPTRLVSAEDGRDVRPHDGVHAGGMGWHPWRRRWVTVFLEAGGHPSPLGELWYAEADSPLGPWGPAVKVLTHRQYTFYNPCLHLDLSPTNSPMLLFEGTYTREFSGNPTPTPRHDYNQILYRLDLDDPRLRPAQVPGQRPADRP